VRASGAAKASAKMRSTTAGRAAPGFVTPRRARRTAMGAEHWEEMCAAQGLGNGAVLGRRRRGEGSALAIAR